MNVELTETKRTFKYQFYFYCQPYLLFLEDELIIDANIEKNSDDKDILVVESDDIFFQENLKKLKQDNFTIVFQTFDSTDNFINQMEFHGEKFVLMSNKLVLEFESTLVDNVSSQINPFWTVPIELYKKERVSYIRNRNIETLLS